MKKNVTSLSSREFGSKRRRLLKKTSAGAAVLAVWLLPKKWQKPVVNVVGLPAHAQMSPVGTPRLTTTHANRTTQFEPPLPVTTTVATTTLAATTAATTTPGGLPVITMEVEDKKADGISAVNADASVHIHEGKRTSFQIKANRKSDEDISIVLSLYGQAIYEEDYEIEGVSEVTQTPVGSYRATYVLPAGEDEGELHFIAINSGGFIKNVGILLFHGVGYTTGVPNGLSIIIRALWVKF